MPPTLIVSALDGAAQPLDSLLAEVASAPLLRPFDATVVSVCDRLSGELVRMRDQPAAVSLGFWLRATAIERLRQGFADDAPAAVPRVPVGTVLHVTPANVDTMFVYSWVLALLAGDRSIVRLSSRSGPLRERLVEAVRTALQTADPSIRAGNRFVLTDHDDLIMGRLSAAADARVIWGGDRTVEQLRRLPLRPRGRDITFPDRHSLAILDAHTVATETDEQVIRLGAAFFNDAYWFDQGACSSPRLLIWSSERADASQVELARDRFRHAVRQAIDARRYESQVGIAIAKMTFSLARAATGHAVIQRDGNEATWVLLDDLGAYDRESCGGGLFFEVVSGDLQADLLSFVGARDQTAACYGLDTESVRRLALAINGRGIDRWVPVGRALEFGAIWDGYDLLAELTRRVVIDLPTDTRSSRAALDSVHPEERSRA